MILTTTELLEMKGGALKTTWGTVLFLLLGGVLTILAGIADGLTNPNKCNN